MATPRLLFLRAHDASAPSRSTPRGRSPRLARSRLRRSSPPPRIRRLVRFSTDRSVNSVRRSGVWSQVLADVKSAASRWLPAIFHARRRPSRRKFTQHSLKLNRPPRFLSGYGRARQLATHDCAVDFLLFNARLGAAHACHVGRTVRIISRFTRRRIVHAKKTAILTLVVRPGATSRSIVLVAAAGCARVNRAPADRPYSNRPTARLTFGCTATDQHGRLGDTPTRHPARRHAPLLSRTSTHSSYLESKLDKLPGSIQCQLCDREVGASAPILCLKSDPPRLQTNIFSIVDPNPKNISSPKGKGLRHQRRAPSKRSPPYRQTQARPPAPARERVREGKYPTGARM